MRTILRKCATALVALALGLGSWILFAHSSAEAAPGPVLGWGFPLGDSRAEFDGTGHLGLYNSPANNDIRNAAELSTGSVQVSFTPRKADGRQSLAHFFNHERPDDGIVLGTDGSAIFWKVGADEVSVPVDLKLGEPHQIHVSVSGQALQIFLDASPVYFGEATGFLATIDGFDSFDIAGRNTGAADSYTDHFTGTLQRLAVLSEPLTTEQMRTASTAINRFPAELADFAAIDAHLQVDKTEPTRWVFTGDSITHGLVHTYGTRSWSEHFAQRLAELGHANDLVVNTAISGDTSVGVQFSGDSTLGVNTTFDARVKAYAPDVVIVMLGMNDAASQVGISQQTYIDNMSQIVDKIRALGATPILAAANPIRSAAEVGTRAAYPAYAQGLRELAAAKQVILVDHFAEWSTQPGGIPAAWFGDAIHPGALGHWNLARELLETLGAWDPTTGLGAETVPARGGFVPNSALQIPVGDNQTQTYGYGFVAPFDGTNPVDRSADLANFPLHRQVEGTYGVRFATASRDDGVLVALSDATRADTALTIHSVDGGVRALVTRRGETLLDLATGDLGLADNREHTVALSAGNGTTSLSVDSRVVAMAPTQVFGADVDSADTLSVGGLRDADGLHLGFTGRIGRLFALKDPTEPVQQMTMGGNNQQLRAADVQQMLATLTQSVGRWQERESRPMVVLTEGLQAGENGWRRWSDNLQERHRAERNYRQDYIVTATPGAASLPQRVTWLLADNHLAASRLVLIDTLDADLAAAGDPAAYTQQVKEAVAAVRTAQRLPILMTSVTAGAQANAAVRAGAAASGAVLFDMEDEALKAGSGVVPASWAADGQLTALGHERVTFRVLKDMATWGGGNLANSHPVAPARAALGAPASLSAAAGTTVEIPLTLSLTGTAHDAAFGVHVAGRAATVSLTSDDQSTAAGPEATLLLPGEHTGTVRATATIEIPSGAAGTALTVVVNGSLGNQQARIPAQRVGITVTTAPESTQEPTASPEPTVSPTAEPTATSEPTAEPTVTPTSEPTTTPKPTPAPTLAPTTTPTWVPTAPYTVPGLHQLNGRTWHTTCEAYSQTTRCRTEIWADTVVLDNGRYVAKKGWVFNNLTYLPLMERAAWAGNPLAENGAWRADDGRAWRTECDTAATGRNGCRSYVWATVHSRQGTAVTTYDTWVFNNIVMFRLQ